jgi:hypothetical protein
LLPGGELSRHDVPRGDGPPEDGARVSVVAQFGPSPGPGGGGSVRAGRGALSLHHAARMPQRIQSPARTRLSTNTPASIDARNTLTQCGR